MAAYGSPTVLMTKADLFFFPDFNLFLEKRSQINLPAQEINQLLRSS